jgi:stage III sporulation protein AB
MFKLIGAVMVIVAAGLAGMALANAYARRPKELRQMRSALQMLETEIAYTATLLPDAFSQISLRCEQAVARLFDRAAAELKKMSGCTAREAWEAGINEYSVGTALTESDLSILRNLGNSLGVSDQTDQVKHLHLAMEQLKATVEKAEEEATRNVKLWNYLGFLGGLMVVLILY